MITKKLLLLCVSVTLAPGALAQGLEHTASTSNGKVKVFILAGQSNMEGRGFPEPLAWQVSQEKYRDRYTHLLRGGDHEAFTRKVTETTDPDDRKKTPTYLWSTRRDVWIN